MYVSFFQCFSLAPVEQIVAGQTSQAKKKKNQFTDFKDDVSSVLCFTTISTTVKDIVHCIIELIPKFTGRMLHSVKLNIGF